VSSHEIFSYLPVRQSLDALANYEPCDAIAQEACESADAEKGPGGKLVAEKARQQAHILAQVLCHS